MALQKATAQAWMKATAILLLAQGAMLLIMGVLMPFVYALVPPAELLAEPGGRVIGAVIGVFLSGFYLVFGAALLLLGLGVWAYRNWARITMIVLGWVGAAALLLLALFFGLVFALDGGMAPDLPSTLALALLVGLFILFGAMLAVHLWLFQFEPTVEQLFAAPAAGSLRPSVDAANARSIVGGLSIITWMSALNLAIIGLALLVLAPLAKAWLTTLGASGLAAPDMPPAMIASTVQLFTTILLVAGVVCLGLGVLCFVLGRGLWQGREGARLGMVILLWVGAALCVLGAVAIPFLGAEGFDIAEAYVSLIAYLVWIMGELYLLQHPAVVALFKPQRK